MKNFLASAAVAALAMTGAASAQNSIEVFGDVVEYCEVNGSATNSINLSVGTPQQTGNLTIECNVNDPLTLSVESSGNGRLRAGGGNNIRYSVHINGGSGGATLNVTDLILGRGGNPNPADIPLDNNGNELATPTDFTVLADVDLTGVFDTNGVNIAAAPAGAYDDVLTFTIAPN